MKGEDKERVCEVEATPLRPFSRSLPMALLKTREATMRLFRPALQAHGLTEQQWRVLRALGSVESVDAATLAGITFLLAPSLTRILRGIEARGLILRSANPLDRRAAVLSLSPQGAALLQTIGADSERLYRFIEGKLGAQRLDELMTVLADVERRLGETDTSS